MKKQGADLQTTAAGSASPAQIPYIRGLDGLRAVAVVAVLIYHADLGLRGGFLGVESFFVISGFLITALLLSDWSSYGRVRLGMFWWRRARRLLPALFALLAGVVAITLIMLPGELGRLADDTLAALGYVTNWHLLAAGQPYFDPVARPSLLRHLWSLAVEEQFYIIWPLLLAAGLRRLAPRRLLALTLLGAAGSAALMAALFVPGADPSRIYYGTDTRAAGLLLGAALAFVWAPGRAPGLARFRWAGPTLDAGGLLALVGLLLAYATLGEDRPLLYRGGLTLVTLLTAALVAVTAHPAARLLPAALELPPLRWIGLRSYGIYLWHWPIFMLTRPGLDLPAGWSTQALRFGLTLALAAASYRFIELPIRRGALERAWGSLRRRLRASGPMRGRLYRTWALSGVMLGLSVAISYLGASITRPPQAALDRGADGPGVTSFRPPVAVAVAPTDDPGQAAVSATAPPAAPASMTTAPTPAPLTTNPDPTSAPSPPAPALSAPAASPIPPTASPPVPAVAAAPTASPPAPAVAAAPPASAAPATSDPSALAIAPTSEPEQLADGGSPTATEPPPSDASPGSPQLDPEIAAELQSILDSATARGIPGALLSVRLADGSVWTGASGMANREAGQTMTAQTRVRIGSLSKIFTAVAVLQLVEEGRIGLDDPVGAWLPELIDDGNRITVRMLLQHTSGLYDYLEDTQMINGAFGSPDREWRPEELVAYADSFPLRFAPGAQGAWDYSSTNYVILGMLVEQVTGHTLAAELDRRIFSPLGLGQTISALRNGADAPQARGYSYDTAHRNVSPSFSFGTANIVTTIDDLRRFGAALFDGELLGPEMMGHMRGFVSGRGQYDMPALRYGLGLMANELPVGPRADGQPRAVEERYVLGHIGGFNGFRAALWYAPQPDILIVLDINQSATDPNDLAAEVLDTLLDAQGR